MKDPQPNLSQQFDLIIKALERFPKGASLEVIKQESGLDIETRTLQRRLDKLRTQGIVAVSGKTRSVIYHLEKSSASSGIETSLAQSEGIPLSEKGTKIREAVSKPVHTRRPVGYNPEFLKSYRPNFDSYLTVDEKSKLAGLGKTNSLNQPAGTYAKEILQRLLIDLAWNSSRLEGNTYSLLDTQRLISQGKLADHKSAAEAQMILNHKDAMENLVSALLRFDIFIIICALHR